VCTDYGEEETALATNEELREQAIKAIKRKRDFKAHLVTHVIVNAFLAAVWYMTSPGYFWPGWAMGGWGIGVAFNVWDAYGRHAERPQRTAIASISTRTSLGRRATCTVERAG